MTRRFIVVTVVMLGVLALGGALSSVTAADVRIGVNIGAPAVVVAPPPPIYVAPPAPVVVAPPVPVVIAPGVPVYYYGASYYTYYNGAWFIGPGYGGPWRYVHRVPPAIVAVPRAPSGRFRKAQRPPVQSARPMSAPPWRTPPVVQRLSSHPSIATFPAW